MLVSIYIHAFLIANIAAAVPRPPLRPHTNHVKHNSFHHKHIEAVTGSHSPKNTTLLENLAKRDLITCFEGYDGTNDGANSNAIDTSIQILKLQTEPCIIAANDCTLLNCQSWSGISGGVLACNRDNTPMSMDCAAYAGYAEMIKENCAAVQYSDPRGTKFDLYYGAYGTTDMEIQIGRC